MEMLKCIASQIRQAFAVHFDIGLKKAEIKQTKDYCKLLI